MYRSAYHISTYIILQHKMKVIVLCGGNGTRLEDYSLPKPLNMIHGRPSIAYCLQNLPSHISTVHFIVAQHLQKYNFEQTVRSHFKERTCVFHRLPYFTRGPVESAWLGTQDFADSQESIVFLDNDVVYNFPPDFFENKDTAFLGYAKDTSTSEAFSFLRLENGFVTHYKEKKRISDLFCCGVYGFKDIAQFRTAANCLLQASFSGELYMSSLYQQLLSETVPIKGYFFDGDVYHIGSLKEIQQSWSTLRKPAMRVCFDLDNTLVTYPDTPGDYSTVKPIPPMIALVRKLHEEGHTIIIHTARRMATHKHNVGAVIRDIGAQTMQTLADFGIPYDELLFGKPIADIYVDDRSVNPYRESIRAMGYLPPEEPVQPLNMLPTNKYNTIEVQHDRVIKKGPTQYLSGEIYYYEHIPAETALSMYFPRYYGSASNTTTTSTLILEHIKGIPFYTLYKSELLTQHHIAQLFDYVDILHHTPGPVPPSIRDIQANYTEKLRDRFTIADDYPFPDAKQVQDQCLARMEEYTPTPTSYIHGDLWFSNILIDYKNNIKCIDMKGQMNGTYTTGGDILYDYAKLYQSFLGYDTVLYNDVVTPTYMATMKHLFLTEVTKRGISLPVLESVTFSLVMGTLHSIRDVSTKQRVWDWIKTTFVESSTTL